MVLPEIGVSGMWSLTHQRRQTYYVHMRAGVVIGLLDSVKGFVALKISASTRMRNSSASMTAKLLNIARLWMPESIAHGSMTKSKGTEYGRQQSNTALLLSSLSWITAMLTFAVALGASNISPNFWVLQLEPCRVITASLMRRAISTLCSRFQNRDYDGLAVGYSLKTSITSSIR